MGVLPWQLKDPILNQFHSKQQSAATVIEVKKGGMLEPYDLKGKQEEKKA